MKCYICIEKKHLLRWSDDNIVMCNMLKHICNVM